MKHLSELKPGQRPNLRTHPHIENATEPIVFVVEYVPDVKGSKVGSIENCAGARALCRVAGIVDARVMESTTYLEFEDGRIKKYRNPAPLRQAVDGFDHTAGLFPPGEYRVVPPKASDFVGARKERPRGEVVTGTRKQRMFKLR